MYLAQFDFSFQVLNVLGLVVTHWDQVVGLMETGLFLQGKNNLK